MFSDAKTVLEKHNISAVYLFFQHFENPLKLNSQHPEPHT